MKHQRRAARRIWPLEANSRLSDKRIHLLPALLFIFLVLPLLAWALATAAAEDTGMPELAIYPWVFLRDGQALDPTEQVVTLLTVGDVMPGRGVTAEPNPLGDTARWLGKADLTLGNLEAVLVDGSAARQSTGDKGQPIILGAPSEAAEWLSQAGFDILGVANNHSLDYGSEGLAKTIDKLEEAGLDGFGFSIGSGNALPLYKDINGLTLAFLAINAVPDPQSFIGCPTAKQCWPRPISWNQEDVVTAIQDARMRANAVIVSVHWGFEYDIQKDPSQENAAQIMLRAGADLIIGHHPHVVQDIAVDGDRVTAYSLGNLIFDQGFNETAEGVALQAFFDQEGLRAVQVLPLRAGSQPRLMSLSEGAPLLDRVLPAPQRVGFVCDETGCRQEEAPQVEQAGSFFAGQIDLTGDGKPETVRREGGRITVYENGSAVWQSPPAWRVMDADLGDPNDDGRYEIVLVLWQKDKAGYERCQPYIVGYRGGTYKLLWGGRPVADPIREAALGDVNGDGVDELIVIEELADGTAQTISVWRWSGWSFGLVWRSLPGRYRDLILTAGSQPMISAVLDTG